MSRGSHSAIVALRPVIMTSAGPVPPTRYPIRIPSTGSYWTGDSLAEECDAAEDTTSRAASVPIPAVMASAITSFRLTIRITKPVLSLFVIVQLREVASAGYGADGKHRPALPGLDRGSQIFDDLRPLRPDPAR